VADHRQHDGLSRRSLLTRAVATGAALSVPAWATTSPLAAASTAAQAFRTSLSVSPFTETVLKSLTLSDSEQTAHTVAEVQQLFNRHGATEVYQRIATRKVAPQGDAEHGWARGLERARLARDLGMPFNPELGLFASYGDGATYQEPPDFADYPSIRLPGPWLSLTLEQMLPPLREYAALVARQILSTGVTVNFWDLGNEVENGISGVAVRPLFPDNSYQAPNAVDPLIGTMSVPGLVAMPEDQRIAFCQAHLWPYVGRLLGAAAEGIRSVDPSARFSTHISHFGHRTPAVQVAFWQAAKAAGYLPDQLGTSYYPTDGKTTFGAADMFAFFKDTASALQTRFDRQMFIAEYGYPSSLMQPPYPFNDPVPGYQQTEAGQRDFLHDLVAWGMSSGRLAGIRPWAADYASASGWQPMSWFDVSGKGATPKPVLGVIDKIVPRRTQSAPSGASGARLIARLHRGHGHELLLRVHTTTGTLNNLVIELRRNRHLVNRIAVASVGTAAHDVVLRPHRGHIRSGSYTLTVTQAGHTLLRRAARVG